MEHRKKNRFSRRHWLVIIFGLLLYYFYTSTVPDGMNVILPRITSESGLNYDLLLTLTTAAGVGSTIVVLLLGRLCVKLGAARMITVSMLAAAFFFWLYGHVTTFPVFFIAVFGLISCANSYAFIGCGALVASWFPTKKGIASGYTAIGAPCSSMTSVTLYTICFASFGFRPTMTVIAVIMAAFAVICMLVLKDTPEECGEDPDSIPPEERSADELKMIDNTGDTMSVRQLLTIPQVWLIAIFVGIYSMVLMGILAQFIVRHNELPISGATAIVMFTVMSIIGLFGGPLWGRLEAHLGTRKAFIICVISISIGMALNFTNILPLVWLSLLSFGLGATGTHVFLNAWIVTIFGRRHASAAYSVIYPIHCIINYLAYAVIALAKTLFGEMRYAYLFFIASLILGLLLCLVTKRLKTE